MQLYEMDHLSKIEYVHIEPGKSWQNGTNESINGKFRDEW